MYEYPWLLRLNDRDHYHGIVCDNIPILHMCASCHGKQWSQRENPICLHKTLFIFWVRKSSCLWKNYQDYCVKLRQNYLGIVDAFYYLMCNSKRKWDIYVILIFVSCQNTHGQMSKWKLLHMKSAAINNLGSIEELTLHEKSLLRWKNIFNLNS